MLPLQDFAEELVFGAETEFENLTMVPVMGSTDRAEPDYLLLKEAMEAKLAKVTEVGGGTVPELLFENLADRPVLILEGEELVGAKQNRIVNLTILAAPKSRMVIPVSCVEAGRWTMVSKEFSPSTHMAFSGVRRICCASVTRSMRSQRSRRSDQGHVWQVIGERAASLGASSPTEAMMAIYEKRLGDVEDFVRAMPFREGQTGAAFLIGGKPAGLDVFDHPRTMQQNLARLIRSYALDALAQLRAGMADGAAGGTAHKGKENGASPQEALRRWLNGLTEGQVLIEPAIGMGHDVRVLSEHLTGAALWAQERFVHFCAFSTDETGEDWQRTRADRLRDLLRPRHARPPRPPFRSDPDEQA